MSSIINILAKELMSDGAVKQIAKASGVKADQAESVIGNAIPLLVQAMSDNAGTQEGAESLFGALGQHASSESAAAQLKNADAVDGDKIIGKILGSNKQGVTEALAQKAGISRGNTASILALMAPVLLSLIGNQTGNASAGGLSSLLSLFTDDDIGQNNGGNGLGNLGTALLMSALLGGGNNNSGNLMGALLGGGNNNSMGGGLGGALLSSMLGGGNNSSPMGGGLMGALLGGGNNNNSSGLDGALLGNNNNNANNSADLLGALLGGGNNNSYSNNNANNGGDLLGALLGGGNNNSYNNNNANNGGDLLGALLGGSNNNSNANDGGDLLGALLGGSDDNSSNSNNNSGNSGGGLFGSLLGGGAGNLLTSLLVDDMSDVARGKKPAAKKTAAKKPAAKKTVKKITKK